MADSGLFDILGHPDLVKKFSHVPTGDLDRFYGPAMDAIAASGCAIEFEYGGLAQAVCRGVSVAAFSWRWRVRQGFRW